MILIACFLAISQLTRYSRVRANFPTGLKIAGIPVGGLNDELASDRLVKVYMSPIELTYGDQRIQVRPATLGYELKLQNMLAVADKQRTSESCWSGFWKYLWNQPITSHDVALQAEVDENRVRAYLETEIASRYDEFAEPPMPVPGESYFSPGKKGTAINYSTSIERIIQALNSANNRSVRLDVVESQAAKPGFELLDYMLRDIIKQSAFDGWVELYMKDLQSGQVLHFNYTKVGEEELPINIAYSAWSTIKIPALLSAFKYLEEPYDPAILTKIEEMVEQSDNRSTDFVGKNVIERNLGPCVSAKICKPWVLKILLGWLFRPRFALVTGFQNAANQDTSYDTDRTVTPKPRPGFRFAFGRNLLLRRDYGGAIPWLLKEITHYECQLMVEYMAKNRIAVFLQGGVPPETQVAINTAGRLNIKMVICTPWAMPVSSIHRWGLYCLNIHLPPCSGDFRRRQSYGKQTIRCCLQLF